MSDPASHGTENIMPRVTAHEPTLGLACRLMWQAVGEADRAAFLVSAVKQIGEELPVDFVAVARPELGRWKVTASEGPPRDPPQTLLADALDQETTLADAGASSVWIASPLAARARLVDVLVIHTSDEAQAQSLLAAADALAATLTAACRIIDTASQSESRLARLETILEITSHWNRERDLAALLAAMAEAATRLLGADRASIFLWDKSRRMLIGRPALGVEGGELRIRDDEGVVGQVVRNGETRRANTEQDPEEISTKVDESTGYQTRSLVCVPLRGEDGRVFGAFEVLNKLEGQFTRADEVALEELAVHAAIPLANAQEREALLAVHEQLVQQAAESVRLIGDCAAMDALRSTVERVADTDLAVLILGENGTGKEVVAQMMHYLSARRDQPFVAVNCAAISETLLESELFGHEKGAFTDAHEARPGKFELASGGTLFLDEIGDMSPGGQAKLLRVLEEKVVVRVGGSQTIRTDARIIAATNQQLSEMVAEKKFREDLFYRLNVVSLELPPLRDRDDDTVLLAEHFLGEFCPKAGRKVPKLAAAAKKRLRMHTWPGNVRELRNLMERVAYLTEGDRIEAEDLAFILTPGAEPTAEWQSLEMPLSEATSRFQVDYISRMVDRSRGNMSEAAQRLGLHRSNLYRKMKQLDMSTPDGEGGEGADNEEVVEA
ncbi:MAG: sigma-54-dependent Fis family transcriptional regulator [Pirellulales bacterium]|nr:sigma-54-dependent Fis family transcriptional regulator [Pirellulales bacterium]